MPLPETHPRCASAAPEQGAASRRRAPAQPSAQGRAVDVDAACLRLLRGAFAPARPGLRALEALGAALREHALPAGPLTGLPRTPAWWLLAEGRVALGTRCGSRFQERCVRRAGSWLDLAAGWDGGGWIDDAECRMPARLWALPLEALQAAAAADPELLDGMGRVMAAQLRELARGRRALATQDGLARVAQWLLDQARPVDDAPVALRLHDEKQSIARQLAMAKETLSRCLRRLADGGLIEVHGYELLLKNPAALRVRASGERRQR